jgi:hypothetical protein
MASTRRHGARRDTARGPRATAALTAANLRVGSVCRHDIAAACRAACEPASAASHPFEVSRGRWSHLRTTLYIVLVIIQYTSKIHRSAWDI